MRTRTLGALVGIAFGLSACSSPELPPDVTCNLTRNSAADYAEEFRVVPVKYSKEIEAAVTGYNLEHSPRIKVEPQCDGEPCRYGNTLTAFNATFKDSKDCTLETTTDVANLSVP